METRVTPGLPPPALGQAARARKKAVTRAGKAVILAKRCLFMVNLLWICI
jgi:hypothetical protein